MAATQSKDETLANGDVKSEFQLPEWLKQDLFEQLLRDKVEGYRKINKFKAHKALAAGENYATIMLRVEIEVELEDGKSKSLSYMLKIPQQTLMFKDFMKTHNIFDVEMGMYLDIVPELEQLYRDHGIEVKFGAQCYKLPVGEGEDNVLLEDLRPYGFKNVSRLEGLDMEHTRSVLKKLAQWHAASAVRVETKGKYPDIYTNGFFNEDILPAMRTMNDMFSKNLMQHIKSYNGHEVYLEAVEKLLPKVVDELMKVSKANPNEFNVLNHGDCWSNNIMFQHDAFGKIKETYFVDYQLPKYGTPAQDLLYFLISSTNLDLKLKQFEYFIQYYHQNLVEYLKLLKYPKKLPLLKEIHMAAYKYGIWGFSTATGVMTAVLCDPTEEATFDNFVTDAGAGNDFKSLLFSNARYRKHIEMILPWLHNRGALEC